MHFYGEIYFRCIPIENSFKIHFHCKITCIAFDKFDILKHQYKNQYKNIVCKLPNGSSMSLVNFQCSALTETVTRQSSNSNLLSFLLKCDIRPYEWGTQWDSNSLMKVWVSGLLTIKPSEAPIKTSNIKQLPHIWHYISPEAPCFGCGNN